MNATSLLSAAAAVVGLSCAAVANEDLLPEARSAGSVAYRSGGIGAEERAALRAHARDYNLRLTFAAEGRGAYLGGAKVRIEDSDGHVVLDAGSEGPWFFARLPKGRYRVVASHETGAIARDVDLSIRSVDLVLRWNVPVRD